MPLLRRRLAWTVLLAVHAGLVLVLTVVAIALLATTPEDGGANIGAGIIALPLLPLGLPWSLVAIIDPYLLDPLPRGLWYLVLFAPAPLNVVLHAAAFVLTGRRAAPRSAA